METKQAGRLAFRVEGNMWNCYYAMPDTMEDAIWLGSLHMAIAENPKHKQAFMKMMKSCLNDFFRNLNLNLAVDHWIQQTAPEHERTKE